MHARIVEQKLSDGSRASNVHIDVTDEQGATKTLVIAAISERRALMIVDALEDCAVWAQIGVDSL